MYDYVVIGAGSAGCVVANRLSEKPAANVLLLEAGGPDDRMEIHVPLLFSQLLGTEYVWEFQTEPQAGMGGLSMFWPRGKMLGGCSSMNAMIYVRGHRAMYDRWAELGNEGWSYREVLPLFKRSEHQERGADDYHGVGGPLNVADLRDANPLTSAFVEACGEMGMPANPDFNGREQEGYGYFQVTQKQGKRWSAAVAFLQPAMARPNLTIETRAQALRILFEGERAVGVAYLKDGQIHEVHASQEVVLSGGAINSPQLLMLSGIGPAAQLRKLGLPVVVDLPGVGRNLQDHLAVFLNYHCKEPVSLDTAHLAAAQLEYKHFAKGPWSSNLAEGGAFFKTRPEEPVPDLQIHFTPAWFMHHGRNLPEGYGLTFCPTLLLPESAGYLELKSADPLAKPLLEPNYLASAKDVETLLAGVKFCRSMAHAKVFEPFVGEPYAPGPEVQTDAELRAHIRGNAGTLYHPVGTCKMGLGADAVVDPRLRVHGCEGLRVADASIMPFIVNGNTHAPTMMIGEKAAELVLESVH